MSHDSDGMRCWKDLTAPALLATLATADAHCWLHAWWKLSLLVVRATIAGARCHTTLWPTPHPLTNPLTSWPPPLPCVPYLITTSPVCPCGAPVLVGWRRRRRWWRRQWLGLSRPTRRDGRCSGWWPVAERGLGSSSSSSSWRTSGRSHTLFAVSGSWGAQGPPAASPYCCMPLYSSWPPTIHSPVSHLPSFHPHTHPHHVTCMHPLPIQQRVHAPTHKTVIQSPGEPTTRRHTHYSNEEDLAVITMGAKRITLRQGLTGT